GSLCEGLLFAPIFGLVAGISSATVSTTTIPNQRIKRSARSAILAGLGCCLGIILIVEVFWAIFFLSLGGTVSEFVPSALVCSVIGVGIGLMFGIPACLAYGGYAVLSHLALRLVLWRQGAMPWNYAAFLDYAASRVFLRKVGGAYIFVHRMLLEY